MPQTRVLENINQILEKLPEPIQIQILHYVETLGSQYAQETPSNNSETPEEIQAKKRNGFGIWKGKISMADNFDEPLEDMQDYM
ncbi:MAG: DUF2281 domain-containing protein [Coleofasciculaceae cyanobacterium SM2_1_6]|nr:DUF2281 domain-containing protein [Coleofasciculaceae cyanobacterium SM2_1_6]